MNRKKGYNKAQRNKIYIEALKRFDNDDSELSKIRGLCYYIDFGISFCSNENRFFPYCTFYADVNHKFFPEISKHKPAVLIEISPSITYWFPLDQRLKRKQILINAIAETS